MIDRPPFFSAATQSWQMRSSSSKHSRHAVRPHTTQRNCAGRPHRAQETTMGTFSVADAPIWPGASRIGLKPLRNLRHDERV